MTLKNTVRILTITLPLVTTNAYSLDYEKCKGITSFATTAMRVRQSGVSLKTVLDEKFYGDNLRVIESAYRTPRFSTKEYQEDAINEFSNKILIECLSL